MMRSQINALLREEPDETWSAYHVYWFSGDRPVRIDFRSGANLIRHFLFAYDDHQERLVELHVGSGKSIVERVDVVELDGGRPIRYTEYGMHLHRAQLHYHDGRVVRIEQCSSLPEFPDSPPCPSTYEVAYRGDAVERIDWIVGEERQSVYPRSS